MVTQSGTGIVSAGIPCTLPNNQYWSTFINIIRYKIKGDVRFLISKTQDVKLWKLLSAEFALLDVGFVKTEVITNSLCII